MWQSRRTTRRLKPSDFSGAIFNDENQIFGEYQWHAAVSHIFAFRRRVHVAILLKIAGTCSTT
jgi:hypothetical protein